MEGGNNQTASLGGHWVETQSAEYDLVRYQLTAALANIGTVEKLSVWKIENMELNYKYERRSNGMLRLSGWQNAESLSGENSLEHICARGFHYDAASAKGLTLATGVVEPLAEYALSMEQCFLFYEMAVGKSFVFDGEVSQAEVPSGYDSLYIPPKPLDRNRDGKFSLQEYQSAATFDHRTSKEYNHRYFISDVNQVSPKYIVRFRVQKLKDNIRASDYLHLIHSGGVNDVQFIDPITLQPGNPGAGLGSTFSVASGAFYHDGGPTTPGRSSMNALEKRFLPVEKVYTQAVEEVMYFDHDASMVSKNQWVNRQLSSIEEKVREISLNYAEMVEVIEDAAKQAKERLQEAVRQKLELCLSLEIELRRETEQMNWLQDTMTSELKKYQQAIVESNSNDSTRRKLMLQFLKLWKQHSLMRNNLCRSKPNELQALSSVHGDIRIQPDIKLYTDPFHATNVHKGKDSPNAKAATDQHQVNRFLHDFSERAKTLDMFSPATVTGQNSLIPSAVQSVIDQEMEAIQRIVVDDSNDQALRLPNSIIRPLLGGNHMTLPLHAALDWLKKEVPQDVNNLSDVMESASNVGEVEEMKEVLKDSFANALPAALGYNAEHAHTHGADIQQAEMVPPPPPFAQSSSSPAMPSSPKSNHQKLDLQQLSLSPRQDHHHQHDHEPVSPMSSVSKFGGGSAAGLKKADPPVEQHNQSGLFPSGDTDMDVKMNLPQLKSLVQTYKHHYISDLGAKKHKQLQVRLAAGIDQLGYNPLKSSRIVLPEEVENLYYCLPFFSKPPMLRALYSTYTHHRSLEELFSKTIKNRNPTLMLIRSGDYRFGAYLSHAPVPTSNWMGSPSCFIFSLSLNVKVPFHGRQVLGETNLQEPMALFCHGDRIFIGNGDLSIDDKLMSGSSELENSYGLGMEQHSTEAMCLLAGSPVFPISDLELWTVMV